MGIYELQDEMDMPTLCDHCGKIREFSDFRHHPACDQCLPSGTCSNMVCDDCYHGILDELDGQAEEAEA